MGFAFARMQCLHMQCLHNVERIIFITHYGSYDDNDDITTITEGPSSLPPILGEFVLLSSFAKSTLTVHSHHKYGMNEKAHDSSAHAQQKRSVWTSREPNYLDGTGFVSELNYGPIEADI